MSQEFRRKLLLPLAVILIGCYLIGLRFYQNRETEIAPPVTTLNPNDGEKDKLAMLASGEKININTATISELTLLDGIGEVIATRIVSLRAELGKFDSVEQLKTVEGIGNKVFDNIKDYIVIE